MSKIEDKIVQGLDLTIEGAKAAGAKLAELAEQYGPQAVDMILTIVRLENGGKLLGAAVALAVFSTAFIYGIKIFRKGLTTARAYKKEYWKASGTQSSALEAAGGTDGDGYMWFGSILSVISGGLSLAALGTLTSLWIWVGLFAPELWLARKAIEKVIG